MGAIIIFIISLVLFIALIGLYAYKSTITINSNETGVLVRFGQVTKTLDSGVHFCPYLIQFTEIVRCRKTPIKLKIVVDSAITTNGVVKNYKEDGREIERTELNVSLTVTTYLSHNLNDLKKTLANSPRDSKEAGQILADYVMDVIRSVASEMPWPLFNGSWVKLSKYVLSKIVPNYEYYKLVIEDEDNDKKPNKYSFSDTISVSESAAVMEGSNPFVQFGLDLSRTSITILNIDFSDATLKNSFNEPEIARIKGDADLVSTLVEAEKIVKIGKANSEKLIDESKAIAEKKKTEGAANAEVIKMEGKAKAEARRLMITEIKNNTDLEYLRTLEEMAKGTANTIIYQMPKAFEQKVSSILGGGKPEDFFSLLKDEEVMKTLKEALEKLTKKNN